MKDNVAEQKCVEFTDEERQEILVSALRLGLEMRVLAKDDSFAYPKQTMAIASLLQHWSETVGQSLSSSALSSQQAHSGDR